MSQPTLVFSHANGFPAGTYRLLFEQWRCAGWRVEAVEKFGHDPRWPVSSNWPKLREQLVHFIEGLQAGAPVGPVGPVVLVGHSLGGFLSLLAASHRPDLVRAIVLLDSPLIAGWRAQGLRFAKATKLIHRVSPGRVAERRRQHWPSLEACRAHYAGKPVFAAWDPRVLDDYVAAGTEPDPSNPQGGVRLAFDRVTESRIYDTLPHHLGEVLRRHPLRCPVGFLGGNHSRELRAVGVAATRRLTHGRIRVLQGGHLFPMERPEVAAGEVLALIAELTGG
jgi:pimeloyl-ACP methyl ester carboxylesterase